MTRADAQKMAVKNMGLIYTVANRHGPIGGMLDEDDIAQEMFVAAVDAFERWYDPGRGTVSNFLGCVLWRTAGQLRRRHVVPETQVDEIVRQEEVEWDSSAYFRMLFEDLIAQLTDYSTDLAQALRALYRTDGNVPEAAKLVGLRDSAMYSRIDRIRKSPIGAEIAAAF